MLTHYKLKVYEKALAFAAGAEELSACWGGRHAIVDQFRRAAESMVLNVAEATRLLSQTDKAKTLDYAVGSALECAACLDIARIKGRLTEENLIAEKVRILEITRMLIGLRKAWLPTALSEDTSSYRASSPPSGAGEMRFHHESLDVDQVGSEFMRWFVALPGGADLSDRLCREVDKAATSVVLNVAEGNGRYSQLDHRRFLEIAAASVVKAATYLDLYQRRSASTQIEAAQGRELLNRINAMLNGF